MKKLYLLCSIVLGCTAVQAQVKKGDIVLGGNLGYNHSSSKEDNSGITTSSGNNLGINPSFGKVIKDNLVLGFDVNYTHGSATYNGGSTTTGTGGGGSIFLRKYKPLGNGFYLFGQSSLTGNYTHNAQVNPTTSGGQIDSQSGDVTSFALQFFPGIAYAVSPKWQLEAGLPNFFSITYSHDRQKEYFTGGVGTPVLTSETNNNFSIASSLTGSNTITVGVRYFIGN